MIIGFLADIHEDIESLNLALSLLAQHRCDKMVCLGDIVGFTLPFYQYIKTRNAEACISAVQQHCEVVVAGNHDLYAMRKIPQYQAGFAYGTNWYDLDYGVRAKMAKNRIWLYEDNEIPPALSPASREFLTNLKEIECFALDGIPSLISHFCYPDLSGSAIYFPSQAFHLKKHFQFLEEHGCRIGFSGHGHPEGCLIVDEENFTLHQFGTIKLSDEIQWIVAPCVAHTSRANGCMVLDTEKALLHVLSIKDARCAQQ